MKPPRYLFVIAYDVSDNRNRTRLYRLLTDYGTPIQYSVFECFVTSKQIEELQSAALALIDRRTDSFRFFEICRSCTGRTTNLGVKPKLLTTPVFVF